MKPMHAKLASLAMCAIVGAAIAGVVADLVGVRSLPVTVLVLVFIAVAPTTALAGLLHREDFYYRPVTLLALAEQPGLNAQLLDDWHDPWNHQPKMRITRRTRPAR
jgi:hypothetical protein